MGSQKALLRVGGVRGMATSLRKLGDEDLRKEMKAVSLEAAEKIKPYAKEMVPVSTGALKRSITAQATARYARIVAGTPTRIDYARLVHAGFGKGRRKVLGVKYFSKAIPKAFDAIRKDYFDAMDRLARKFEKKHGVSRVYGRYS